MDNKENRVLMIAMNDKRGFGGVVLSESAFDYVVWKHIGDESTEAPVVNKKDFVEVGIQESVKELLSHNIELSEGVIKELKEKYNVNKVEFEFVEGAVYSFEFSIKTLNELNA